MKKAAILALSTSLLAGCATNRGNASDYERVSAGVVPVAAIPYFSDCVHDAFKDRTIGLGVNLFNREQQRSDMRRIELVSSESGPLLSADIWKDGHFELFEVTYLVRSRVQGERAQFDACATKFGTLTLHTAEEAKP